jgi:hypothetical protein
VKRTVVFYRTAAGCPFENFLDSLPGGIVKKITWILTACEELENVTEFYFKRTGSGDIRECLVECGDAVLRIFCFFYRREMIVLWGGLCVKFRDREKEEAERALRYKNDFLLRQRNV